MGKIRFIQGQAQDVCDLAEDVDMDDDCRPGCVDLAIISDELWFMRPEAAMKNMWELLRPGGTMAMVLYGRPKFVVPFLRSSDFGVPSDGVTIASHHPQQFDAGSGPASSSTNTTAQNSTLNVQEGWKERMKRAEATGRTVQTLFNALATRVCRLIGAADPDHPVNISAKNRFDNVEIDDSKWEDIQRIRWLREDPFMLWDEQPGDEVPVVSRIGPDEIEGTGEPDESPLAAEWTPQHVKHFLEGLIPPERKASVMEDQLLNAWFAEFVEMMNGPWLVKYPVVLITAKKMLPPNQILPLGHWSTAYVANDEAPVEASAIEDQFSGPYAAPAA